jgi:hypothetical protein
MKVLITGGSHTAALFRALQNRQDGGSIQILIRPLGGGMTVARDFFRSEPGHIVITSQRFSRRLPEIPPDDFPCDTVGYCSALYSRPIWLWREWARHSPADTDTGRKFVSSAMVRRMILDDIKYVLQFLDSLATLGLRPFVVDCPRPFRHNPEVARAGEAVIQTLDRSYREIVGAELANRDIPVVAAPASTYDADGFSLPEFAHPLPRDRTHANVEYGALMLAELEKFLAERN